MRGLGISAFLLAALVSYALLAARTNGGDR